MPTPSHVKLGVLTHRIADKAKWQNEEDFPNSQELADEIEKVLTHLQTHGQFSRFLPRLQARKTERDEALAEARVSFLFACQGFLITAWEPMAVPNIPGEYEIQLPGSPAVFVEVKSPGWEAELSEAEKRGPRKSLPKHRNGQTGTVNFLERVFYAAKKAMSKFSANRPNLLVVADDLFVSPLRAPAVFLDSHIKSGLDRSEYDNLGGILLFRASQPLGDSVQYYTRLIENPRARNQLWALPPKAVEILVAAQALPSIHSGSALRRP